MTLRTKPEELAHLSNKELFDETYSHRVELEGFTEFVRQFYIDRQFIRDTIAAKYNLGDTHEKQNKN